VSQNSMWNEHNDPAHLRPFRWPLQEPAPDTLSMCVQLVMCCCPAQMQRDDIKNPASAVVIWPFPVWLRSCIVNSRPDKDKSASNGGSGTAIACRPRLHAWRESLVYQKCDARGPTGQDAASCKHTVLQSAYQSLARSCLSE